ncbi:MAG: cysteine dioxygenase family protein [Aquihabitans sp.]
MSTTAESGGVLSDALLALLARAVASGQPEGLDVELREARPVLQALALEPVVGTPYSRQRIHTAPDLEVMLATWVAGMRCAPHDHGGSHGYVAILEGSFDERRYAWRDRTPRGGGGEHEVCTRGVAVRP